MMYLLLATIQLVQAISWFDLEPSQNYAPITDTPELKALLLEKTYHLDWIETLPALHVRYFRFTATECTRPHEMAPMVLTTFDGVDIGVERNEDCEIDVLAEVRDLDQTAFFLQMDER